MGRYGDEAQHKSKRSKEPKESGHKHKKSKDEERSPESSLLSLPPDLGFLWCIKCIKPDYREGYLKRIIRPGDKKMASDSYQLWLPPNKKKGVKITRDGKIYQWRSTGSRECGVKGNLSHYDTASVFYQARQDNILAAPSDCTEHNVSGAAGWESIHFKYGEKNRSAVVFTGGQETLAVPADGTTWMPQLIPRTYNAPIRGHCSIRQPEHPYGGLCGKLALLIALAAFSTTEDNAERVVSEHFGNAEWRKHDGEHGIGSMVCPLTMDP